MASQPTSTPDTSPPARGKSRVARKAPSRARAEAVARAKALASDLPARIGSTPQTVFRGDPDVFGRLIEDHDRHRALFAMLAQTQGKSPEREMLFRELVREIAAHAAAEEQALWSTVLRDPKTTRDARHAIAEHKEMDELLADLAARDMASPGWLRRLASARQEYLHHIREEEQEQFVAAEKRLSAADRRHMRAVFNRRKREEKAAVRIDAKLKRD